MYRNRTCAKTGHDNVDVKLKQQENKQGTALPKILVNWINSVKQTQPSKCLQVEVDKGSGNCLRVGTEWPLPVAQGKWVMDGLLA
ncbi:unnamed protein product [Arctia plantaginis]|uniref:Uncharacterized protein n=1 Tax=Arctia plantaginis TaxID=874455 RepID=A0A8S1A675_ARCPL|nr:unnamed protein product [Arctia plantaginis]CAB3240399.1 unnamed protein product [Arctia plantaginis]